jgi:hypothetical protein
LIRNATASSFTPAAVQVGKRLRVRVSATNDGGVGVHISAASNPVARSPLLGSAPVVSGLMKFGVTLSASTGSWNASPTPTYAYRWIRCEAAGTASATIPGGCVTIDSDATGSTYIPVEDDIGRYLRIRITATNSAGSAISFSRTTPIIKGIAPASTVAPVVSGTAAVGQTLSATSGSWSGTPSPAGSYTYAWFSCTRSGAATANPSNCSAIRNATSSTFLLTSAQTGRFLRVRVTATNSAGSVRFYSAATSAIAP